MTSPDEPAETLRPALRVVRGDPTAEELAAVAALLAASSGDGGQPTPRVRRGGWNDPSRLHRSELLAGPNAWRASTLTFR